MTTLPQNSDSGVLTFDISYSFPLFFEFTEKHYGSENFSTVIYYRLVSEVTLTIFRENLIDYDFERIVRDDNCSQSEIFEGASNNHGGPSWAYLFLLRATNSTT